MSSIPPEPYETSNIRSLLTEAFSDEDFTIFCFDYFKPVYKKFGATMIPSQKIQLLIEHCERHHLFDKLLSLVKELNPIQYEEFSPYKKSPILSTLPQIETEQPIPIIVQILYTIQQLGLYDAGFRSELGRYLLFLGETYLAREQFLAARWLKPGTRGIKRGWIISASLMLGDVPTAQEVLREVQQKDEFDYRDREHYLAIYDAWCAASSGVANAWDIISRKYLSGGPPPTDIHAHPYVYFELAAGLAATNEIDRAWQAINISDIDLLGEKHMWGLACMPIFYGLQADQKYGPKLEDWFRSHAKRFMLPPLRELRAIVEEWRQGRLFSS